MTAEELYTVVVEQLAVKSIHPLHKAMLEECCESAIKSDISHEKIEELVNVVHIAFMTSLSTLKGTLQGALQFGDSITLNYRNQTFQIPKDSPILE